MWRSRVVYVLLFTLLFVSGLLVWFMGREEAVSARGVVSEPSGGPEDGLPGAAVGTQMPDMGAGARRMEVESRLVAPDVCQVQTKEPTRPVMRDGFSSAQARSLVNDYLEPHVVDVGNAFSGTKYQELVQKIPIHSVHASALDYLARRIDELSLAVKIEKLSIIKEAIQGGTLAALQQGSSKGNALLVGVARWGAPPGDLWGNAGTIVEIRYSLARDQFPRLLEIMKELSKAEAEFEALLGK